MNWHVGLLRLNAVFWSFIGVSGAALSVAGGLSMQSVGITLGGLAASGAIASAGYLLVRWIIDGFLAN